MLVRSLQILTNIQNPTSKIRLSRSELALTERRRRPLEDGRPIIPPVQGWVTLVVVVTWPAGAGATFVVRRVTWVCVRR